MIHSKKNISSTREIQYIYIKAERERERCICYVDFVVRSTEEKINAPKKQSNDYENSKEEEK